MLHSLLVCNEEGFVLMARYFMPSLSLDERRHYEQQVASLCFGKTTTTTTTTITNHARGSAPTAHASNSSMAPPMLQLANVWDRIKKDQVDQLLQVQNQFVVLRVVGELRLLLAGNGEYDEIILEELMNIINNLLMTHLEKKLTEASFLANHFQLLVVLDELVQQGHLETGEEAAIEEMIRLRPYPTK